MSFFSGNPFAWNNPLLTGQKVNQSSIVTPRLSLYLGVAQSITSSGFTNQAISFDTTYRNVGFSANSTNSQFTVKIKGQYLLTMNAQFAVNATGVRVMAPNVPRVPTGNPSLTNVVMPNGTYAVTNDMAAVVDLVIGDVIGLFVGQDSGGPLTVKASFTANWIGA